MNTDLGSARRDYNAKARAEMLKIADRWKGTPYLIGGNSSGGVDCSHFIYQVVNSMREEVEGRSQNPQVVNYRNTAAMESSGLFIAVTSPEMGDLVFWEGHVGIVVNPQLGTFIGAQSSTGVAVSNFSRGYWAKRSVKAFLRFVHFM